jgi:hypothetical protein
LELKLSLFVDSKLALRILLVGVPFANRSIKTSENDFMIRNCFTEKPSTLAGSPAIPWDQVTDLMILPLGLPGM